MPLHAARQGKAIHSIGRYDYLCCSKALIRDERGAAQAARERGSAHDVKEGQSIR